MAKPEWQEAVLGDVITVKHGHAFKGEYFGKGGPVRLVTPGNFFEWGGFRDRGADQKSYDGPAAPDYQLEPGALVVAMTEQAPGLLGSAGLVPNDEFTWLHNQRIGLVLLRHGLADKGFIRHLLNSPAVREQLDATATGTKVRHTAPSRIEAVRTSLPPSWLQRRIGAFLSAFDELIELNEQRVGRLEAVVGSYFRRKVDGAGRLERTKHGTSEHGGLPKGWKRCSLGDVARLTYGRSLPKSQRRPGHVAVVGSAGVIDTHDTALQPGPGLVLGRKGNVGSVWWVEDAFHPIDTTYYVQSDLPLGFLYWALQGAAFVDSHAAVPGLSRDQALAVDIVLPPEAIVTEVAELHRNAFRAIAAYRKVNDAAKMMRDLLLPRLVSGQLDISDVDLGILTSAESE
jgi:type I restriction enzyme, S subunit